MAEFDDPFYRDAVRQTRTTARLSCDLVASEKAAIAVSVITTTTACV